MGPRILGVGFGIFGIGVLDLGFAGSAITDLFHLGNVIPTIPAPTIPGTNLFATLVPGGNIILFIIGGAFLGVGMIILIVRNHRVAKKSSTVAVPSK
ncbi:MAG: hypothetical protein OK422_06000 [Thaumarchaeota archaeon]|nr:hypothetical protein [Nitrososphaerota archaeon]